MKDSMGTIPALVIIFVFIIFISGYIAYTINYSKAFKAKSRIVNIIQDYNNDVNASKNEIKKYLSEINYSTTDNFLKEGCNTDEKWVHVDQQGWCYKIVKTNNGGKGKGKQYVKIRTFISIDVPIINRIFAGLSIFYVDGSTKATTE